MGKTLAGYSLPKNPGVRSSLPMSKRETLLLVVRDVAIEVLHQVPYGAAFAARSTISATLGVPPSGICPEVRASQGSLRLYGGLT